MVKHIKGNLITLAMQGEFDVIAHGCNCFCTQKKGLAPQMVEAFHTDKFPVESDLSRKGDINKLGTLDSMIYLGGYNQIVNRGKFDLVVINAYTQYHWREADPHTGVPLNYTALNLCLQKINRKYKGKKIGLPWIGTDLAGGNKQTVELMIENLLIDCDVTVVEYDNT